VKKISKNIVTHWTTIEPLPNKMGVSFEFFPPKTPQLEKSLWCSVERLAPLNPVFVSVTYGAGGSTREKTHKIVTRLQNKMGIPAAAHLTCVAASKAEVNRVARRYWEAGIRHIVALRGDPPDGQGKYVAHPEGYNNASDLVRGLKMIGDFEISVAAHPEGHPEAKSIEADIENLKRKVDEGATRGITQFFFQPEHFLRFREKTQKAGLSIPIIPGILPVTNFSQVRRFSKICGASIPHWMSTLFEGLDNDPDTRLLIAANIAIDLCRILKAEDVTNFHFYTLNRADLTYAICHVLGNSRNTQPNIAL
tara:strand:+ start:242 stop:1165 length:924 start_codon:yes stop_codon:yes gene_type:complete